VARAVVLALVRALVASGIAQLFSLGIEQVVDGLLDRAANDPVQVIMDLGFVDLNDFVPGCGRLFTHGGGLLVLVASSKANLPERNHRLLFAQNTLRYHELPLALHDIEHRTTKARSPRTNGFVERMNRTLLDENFRIKGRENWYESAAQIQADLDEFLAFYNLKRTHQGYRLKGRTPAQTLRDALSRKKLPPILPKEPAAEVAELA
jgi:hypothetical protein